MKSVFKLELDENSCDELTDILKKNNIEYNIEPSNNLNHWMEIATATIGIISSITATIDIVINWLKHKELDNNKSKVILIINGKNYEFNNSSKENIIEILSTEVTHKSE